MLLLIAGRLRPDFEAWASADLRNRFRLVMGAMGAVTTVPLLGLAIYLWRLARTQEDANRAQLLRALALLLAAAAILLAFFLWRVTVQLTPAR